MREIQTNYQKKHRKRKGKKKLNAKTRYNACEGLKVRRTVRTRMTVNAAN